MDTLELFGPQETYRGCFWLFQSTQGVVGLGGENTRVSDAQFALKKWSGLPLTFNEGQLTANDAWKNRQNVAVVTGKESGQVVAWAPVPDGWYPPGDPRRKP